MLEPAASSCNADRFVHHPLADVKVGVDPFLYVFVIGDLFGVETGSRSPRWDSLAFVVFELFSWGQDDWGGR